MRSRYHLPTFFKLFILFVLGVTIAHNFEETKEIFIIIILSSFLVFAATKILFGYNITTRVILAISLIGFIFGYGGIYYQDFQFDQRTNLSDNTEYIQIQIEKINRIDSNKASLTGEILAFKDNYSWNTVDNSEKLNLTIKTDTLLQYKTGQQLIINSKIKKIRRPSSPYETDFRSIYRKKNIHYQIYTHQRNVLKLNKQPNAIQSYINDFNGFIINNLPIEYAGFIIGITTNNRQYLTKDIGNQIRNNGISHILAISGLHVGILYGILVFILAKLSPFKRKNKLIQSLMICLVLGLYGYICGWTSSISRSILMFTIFEFSRIINRNSPPINNLAFAAFCLVLLNPMNLFEVGFQLSFMGVFSILWILPLFQNWIEVQNKFLQYFWELLTVTISAQIGVVPLLLFYFGEFSYNGILLSLLLIPLVGLIMIIGFLLIICFKIPFINLLLAKICGLILHLFFTILDLSNNWVYKFEYPDISFYHLTLIYSIIFLLVVFINNRHLRAINWMLVCVVSSILAFDFIPELKNKRQYILFEKENTIEYVEKKNEQINSITPQTETTNNLKLSVINATKILEVNKIPSQEYPKTDVLILTEKMNIKELKKIAPKLVFISKRLNYSNRAKLISELETLHIDYHDASSEGYLEL